ncbi:polysaccharide lyase family 7 protein [Pseudomonas borbori]
MRLSTVCLVLAGLALLAGCGKDMEKRYDAPGAAYDLSHWKLTLPDDQASEVRPAQLRGYASPYFHLGDGGDMVFVAPASGGTTENSRYPRSELREVMDPGDDNRNWSGEGSHQLRARCQVLQAPSTEKIIVGQIHGFDARPLVKLQWEKGKVKALIKRHPSGSNADLSHVFRAQVGKQPFSYRLEVQDGVLTVEVNGEQFTHDFYGADPEWRDVQFFFKAGAYVQASGGNADEVGKVVFSELSVRHDKAQ